jgi:hypothetical protein
MSLIRTPPLNDGDERSGSSVMGCSATSTLPRFQVAVNLIYSDGSTAEAWLRELLIDRIVRPLLLDQVAHATHFGLATNAVYPEFEPVIRGMQPVDQTFHDGLLH